MTQRWPVTKAIGLDVGDAKMSSTFSAEGFATLAATEVQHSGVSFNTTNANDMLRDMYATMLPGEDMGMSVGEWKWRKTLEERLKKAPHFGPDALLESVTSGAVAPIRGRYLAKLWESNCKWVFGGVTDNVGHKVDGWVWHGRGERLLRREELPAEAFFSPSELRRLVTALGDDYWVLFVALSYRWLSETHPDPDAVHLRKVGQISRLYLGHHGIVGENPHWLSPLVKAFVNAGLTAKEADFALFWDYGSLFLPPRKPQDDDVSLASSTASSVWYGHAYTICWQAPEVPTAAADAIAAAGRAPGYSDSGWTYAEAAMAAVVKADNRRLDLSKTTERAVRICYSGYGDLSLDAVCGMPRLPPPSMTEMRRLLSDEKGFGRAEDMETVCSIYEDFFSQVTAIVPALAFTSVGPKEGARLSEVLASFTQLTTLDVSIGNLEGRGLNRLARAVISHPTLQTFGPLPLKQLRQKAVESLDLSYKPVSPLGALVLSGVFDQVGCGPLLSLNVSHAGLRDTGTAALAVALGSAAGRRESTIRSLFIENNSIEMAGVTALAQLCEDCRTMQNLSIDTAIGRDAQAMLAKVMKGRTLSLV